MYFRISFSPLSRVLILGNRCFGVVPRVSVFNTDHMKSSVDNKGAQDTPPTHIHTQCGNWTTFGKVAKRGKYFMMKYRMQAKEHMSLKRATIFFFCYNSVMGFFLFVSSCWISEKNVIDGDILGQNYIKR